MNKLKPGETTGPDNISNRILRETSSALAEPLSILFNKGIAKGTFPDAWKQANVIPLFNKGDMTQCNNYRPVSLLPVPCISKKIEKNIFQHFFTTLKNQNIIPSKQSLLPLPMNQLYVITSIQHLIPEMRWYMASFRIFQRPLTKFDIQDYFILYRKKRCNF